MSYSLRSAPKDLRIIAETFWMDSFAISPSFPVAMISFPLPPSVTSDSMGRMMPENGGTDPITARPFTLPTLLPSVTMTSYSLFCSMYLSAICCSRVLAICNAKMTCSLSTTFAFFSTARSPAALITPPSSRRRRVRWPFLFALLLASSMMASTASFVKWGIFLSFTTSCATKMASLSRFSGVSSMVSFM